MIPVIFPFTSNTDKSTSGTDKSTSGFFQLKIFCSIKSCNSESDHSIEIGLFSIPQNYYFLKNLAPI